MSDDKNISVLIDGHAAFDRIINCIDAAKYSIVINVFIWRDDPTGNRVGRALLAAADRGVEIEASVADGPQSIILEQVTGGIAVRMAIMSIAMGNIEKNLVNTKQTSAT